MVQGRRTLAILNNKNQKGRVIQIDGQPPVTITVGFLPPYLQTETTADFDGARVHHDGNIHY